MEAVIIESSIKAPMTPRKWRIRAISAPSQIADIFTGCAKNLIYFQLSLLDS
jgi:hypothetical protein